MSGKCLIHPVRLREYGCILFPGWLGSGSATVRVPEGVPARVGYHIGSGSFNAPNLRQISRDRRNGVYESANFSQSGSYVIMTVDIGSGNVNIRQMDGAKRQALSRNIGNSDSGVVK